MSHLHFADLFPNVPLITASDQPEDVPFEKWHKQRRRFAIHVGKMFTSIRPALLSLEPTKTWGNWREYVIDGTNVSWRTGDPTREDERYEESLHVYHPDELPAATLNYLRNPLTLTSIHLSKDTDTTSQTSRIVALHADIRLEALAASDNNTLQAEYEPDFKSWSTAIVRNTTPQLSRAAQESADDTVWQEYIGKISRDDEYTLTNKDRQQLGQAAELLAAIISHLKH